MWRWQGGDSSEGEVPLELACLGHAEDEAHPEKVQRAESSGREIWKDPSTADWEGLPSPASVQGLSRAALLPGFGI